MRRTPLLAALALAAAWTAPAAQADSTTTQTLPPGGTMRSSPDAAPSPANPVIVTLVARQSFANGCRTNCQEGDASYTITLKDKHDRARGPGLEGPNGYDFVGPQVDITGPHEFTQVDLTFDVDKSTHLPGFFPRPGTFTSTQFFFSNFQATRQGPSMETPFGSQPLADGDWRLKATDREITGSQTGSFDLLQQSFFVKSFYDFKDNGSLETALKKGVGVLFYGNYQTSVKATIKLSPSVAKKLRLKSTTIGSRSFPAAGDHKARIKLSSRARKALKKYKKVVVYIESVHTGPEGKTITKKSKATLTRKKRAVDDELAKLGR